MSHLLAAKKALLERARELELTIKDKKTAKEREALAERVCQLRAAAKVVSDEASNNGRQSST